MYKIEKHPILDVPIPKKYVFLFQGHKVEGEEGFTIAAALHQAGFPVHSHSVTHRNRSVECGIGKCGACEMLVDGQIKRICITKVDGVKEVCEIPKNHLSTEKTPIKKTPYQVYKTTVAIIGAGPAGLAAREELNKNNIDNIVIDKNAEIGGQFLMQTHQFFFFEKERRFGGMRGFEIAKMLAGDNLEGILLNCIVWDILDGKRIAVKNIETEEIFFVDAQHLIVTTGAVPFMPTFENDDVPGVYTAAVVQKMMNCEFTLLGKNVLTVGAGNIGYLTSYQLKQAGANVKAIIEAMPHEGGFPVQANRIRRLGIPIMTSHILLKAIPNADKTGIIGAVIAKCENFKPIAGTEQVVEGIDVINICTGLIPDNQLLLKGNEIFGRNCYGAGDAVHIGEGTSAVLRGRQVAFDVMAAMNLRFNYDEYLALSKEYIESQQHPIQVLEKPFIPSQKRMEEKPFVRLECLYGFACNPCSFACPKNAITKQTTSSVPQIDYDKCIGCMECISHCPGLAIFGYNLKKNWIFLPVEYEVTENDEVYLVDNNGKKLGEGMIEKVLIKPNKTNLTRVKAIDIHGEKLMEVKGFIVKKEMPEPLQLRPLKEDIEGVAYVCHCDDVTEETLLNIVGNRPYISIDELKHTTRVGMGPCRGKRCIPRIKQILRSHGIDVIGDATPRAPLSSSLNLGEVYLRDMHEKMVTPSYKTEKPIRVKALIAGGGMAGSALFRYMAEAGFKPVLINNERGSTWRCLAGGRPAFSHPAIADLAINNLKIFKELQEYGNIDYKPIRYVSFVHDEATYKALEKSIEWSDAYMIEQKDFRKEISEYFNPNLKTYSHALISHNCWQATPGKTINMVRNIAMAHGGVLEENAEVLDVEKVGNEYKVLVHTHYGKYLEYHAEIFVNALGANAGIFAQKLGIETGLYPVKHQAFITRRMPLIGKDGDSLDMLIDRRHYKGFSAVYGQQLKETGQFIVCASPAVDAMEAGKNIKTNTKEFLEVCSDVCCDWIPEFAHVGIQATWAGYYVEPRYIVDPELGLFVGMRGHGFMLSQYIAQLYVNKLLGKPVPEYFEKLKLSGEGLSEAAFK